MRISQGYLDRSGQKKKLFTSLVQECQAAVPVSRLSEKLKRNLEEFSRGDRRDIVGGTVEGCAPLFLACRNGSADVVEYLLSSCDADIEQRGLFEVLEEGISHRVTPLWCAAVSGRLAVVKVLLRYNADVDAVSDSGSTPIRSACYIVRNGLNTSHFEIIKCLVRAGADVEQPNHFGGTCLINSVQSPELVRFLLDSGVNVNAGDVQHKTALHYAVQENRLETVKLLLQHGADPFHKSKYGDDVLQTVCLKGSLSIFNFLLEKVAAFEPARIADAFELMGSTFLLDMHDLGSTLFFWKKAMEIRHGGQYAQYPKRDLYLHPVLDCMEADSQEELDLISGDTEALKLQALLVTERILGSGHKDTIFRYMYAGASHADAGAYKACVALWNYALQLKVRKETLLSCDTSFTARAVVQLYVNIMVRDGAGAVDFSDVLDTASHLNSGMSRALDLLRARPLCKAQADNFDIVLTTWTHLVLILLRVAAAAAAEEEEDEELPSPSPLMPAVFSLVHPVLRLRPRTATGGDSPLHLSVSSSSTLKSNSFLDEDAFPLFPSAEVAEFLLRCGEDAHGRNWAGETPLHIAARPENFDAGVTELLLRRGAHADVPDSEGRLPSDALRGSSSEAASKRQVHLVSFLSLKCLAARAMVEQALPLKGQALPPNMEDFLRLHMTEQQQETAFN